MTGPDGRAFPDEHEKGMTLREYAAIHLRVPDSGTPWLDEMIQKAQGDCAALPPVEAPPPPTVIEAIRDQTIWLTKRERQVIELIAEGSGNKEIAKRLHISINTVKVYVRSIMDKLTLHNRVQIAAYVQAEKTGGTP